eukprot:TRINITY_DN18395_c0_g1_i3.p3 TRINITY_DN18395_c0_g1~~TRINITY_DN18395_c0_g1_i3.p3  ORF type:complete len:179 (+),score=0.43 TRINITY_DN18395_c0_g1_i3:580-1116(+)
MSLRVGTANAPATTGRRRRSTAWKVTRLSSTAPPMTKARLGSHECSGSRKPFTLAGLSMPLKVRPTANTAPDSAADSRRAGDMADEAAAAGGLAPLSSAAGAGGEGDAAKLLTSRRMSAPTLTESTATHALAGGMVVAAPATGGSSALVAMDATAPVVMKVQTAAKLRMERRGSPHTP